MNNSAVASKNARSPTRRALTWIAGIGVAGLVAAAAVFAWFAMSYFNMALDTVGEVDFDRALHVPPLAESRVEGGVRTFDLTMQAGETDLGQGSMTPTWGINGTHLAPTLRAERGEDVQVRVSNGLDEASTLHWHGMHLPAQMDGGPHQMIDPGQTWAPNWRIDQPAASLWYHPHPHGQTARHVYQGLAGMFIIDDQDEAGLDLPRDYGVDDLPLIVQDKKFHDDATLDSSTSFMQSAGITGDTVLVNGTPGPYFDVTTHTVRLRILNGSNTRPYNFAFEDDRAFALISTDGGLLDAPVDLHEVQLSAGERAEIVVAFEPGEQVRLQSGPSDTGDRLAGGADHLDILQFRAGDHLGGVQDVPRELVEMPRIDESTAARTRDFELSGVSINGQEMDMARIDEIITLGDTEIWNVTNLDGQTHNFHIHDVQFQILDIDGREPQPHLRGWKDTVWLPEGQHIRLIMTFTDYPSTQWPYMYHCHTLRHEDQGMMGQFLIVEPGHSTQPNDYHLQPDREHGEHDH
ncbi:multicopper oxidase family protein [Pseudactinotalea sp. Z1739]|uniref:multicopper oxidase family protein n=1 Tax=Pseudactinotalea sp. Z1739 TaxID=3413028 RepID=UPI003C7DF214